MLKVTVKLPQNQVLTYRDVIDVVIYPEGDIVTRSFVSLCHAPKPKGNRYYSNIWVKPLSITIEAK